MAATSQTLRFPSPSPPRPLSAHAPESSGRASRGTFRPELRPSPRFFLKTGRNKEGPPIARRPSQEDIRQPLVVSKDFPQIGHLPCLSSRTLSDGQWKINAILCESGANSQTGQYPFSIGVFDSPLAHGPSACTITHFAFASLAACIRSHLLFHGHSTIKINFHQQQRNIPRRMSLPSFERMVPMTENWKHGSPPSPALARIAQRRRG